MTGCKWCGRELSAIGDCNVWVCRVCDKLPLPSAHFVGESGPELPLRRAYPDTDGDHA